MPKRNRHREALKTGRGTPVSPSTGDAAVPPSRREQGAPRATPATPATPVERIDPEKAAPKTASAPKAKKPPPWVTTPPLSPEARREKDRLKKKRYEARNLKPHIPAVLEALAARWPVAFPRDPTKLRPWAIGLHEDLVKQGLGFSRQLLRLALKHVTKTDGYLTALAAGGPRYDLDGNARGEVTEEQKASAVTRLAELRANQESPGAGKQGETR